MIDFIKQIIEGAVWYNWVSLSTHTIALVINMSILHIFSDTKNFLFKEYVLHSKTNSIINIFYIGSILGWMYAGLSTDGGVSLSWDLGFIIFENLVAVAMIRRQIFVFVNRNKICKEHVNGVGFLTPDFLDSLFKD